MSHPETLLIVGASARAAAQAAVRAGYQVAAIDLFADTDLRAISPVWEILPGEFPEGFVAAARNAPAGPWMYCGGLENHPAVVAAIRRDRELLGVDAETLRRIRDPIFFARQLAERGFPNSTLSGERSSVPDAGHWLLKPQRSSAGRNIREFVAPPYPVADEHQFWSRYIEGVPQSATYLFTQDKVQLHGVTEQLIGTPWTGGASWLYCGNIGPLELTTEVRNQYEQLGECLLSLGGLRGLVGVDTVLGPDERIYPLEINPRYTASMELFERSGSGPFIDWHVQACRDDRLPDIAMPAATEIHGKAILYARSTLQITPQFAQWCHDTNDRLPWPMLADLPAVDTQFEQGQPVLTIFALGGCTEETRFLLRKRTAEVYALLAK